VPAAPGAKFCASCGRSLTEPKRDSQTSSLGAARGTTRAELALLDEAGAVQSRHALRGEDTTVGRADADIRFADDPFLSPLHAQVSVRDGHFYVRDLGSRNGTWYFLEEPYRMQDGDLVLVGSQVLRFRRLGYPGPHPPEHDATRRLGSLIPSADIASLTQLRSDGSPRDVLHLSPGREIVIGRETGDWIFPYDPSMSGTHARVRSEDADFVVVDEGSRNGIAVSVRGEVEIAPGSRFLVGDKMLRLETP
jgi:pSer/pThr/pTyr-binding forkhead associated (FHA) protein